jgi:hypothetical protein
VCYNSKICDKLANSAINLPWQYSTWQYSHRIQKRQISYKRGCGYFLRWCLAPIDPRIESNKCNSPLHLTLVDFKGSILQSSRKYAYLKSSHRLTISISQRVVIDELCDYYSGRSWLGRISVSLLRCPGWQSSQKNNRCLN